MNKFDEREKSFEKKFAKDQELQFKVAARGNKYLGEWAGDQLGKIGEEKQNYIQEIIKADMEEAGKEDVFRKISNDFKCAMNDGQDLNYFDNVRRQLISRREYRGASMDDSWRR